MTNEEVSNDLQVLRQTDFSDIRHTKIHYAVLKNRTKLSAEHEILEEARKKLAPKAFLKLRDEISPVVRKVVEEENKAYLEKSKQKDFDPKKVMKKEPFMIETEILAAWEKKKEWDEQVKKYNEILANFNKDENTFKYHILKLKDIEDSALSQAQMNAIMPFVKD